jgi:DNA-directed RNA polymerase subunit RPC12/RpoP
MPLLLYYTHGERLMIRVICPHCSRPFLILTPPEDDEKVQCPHCKRAFIPDEEEWVDPEDD